MGTNLVRAFHREQAHHLQQMVLDDISDDSILKERKNVISLKQDTPTQQILLSECKTYLIKVPATSLSTKWLLECQHDTLNVVPIPNVLHP